MAAGNSAGEWQDPRCVPPLPPSHHHNLYQYAQTYQLTEQQSALSNAFGSMGNVAGALGMAQQYYPSVTSGTTVTVNPNYGYDDAYRYAMEGSGRCRAKNRTRKFMRLGNRISEEDTEGKYTEPLDYLRHRVAQWLD